MSMFSQSTSNYSPSFPYLFFLKEAIRGGYHPNRFEKELLRKFWKKEEDRKQIKLSISKDTEEQVE